MILYWLFTYNVTICMKLDLDIYIVMHSVLSLKPQKWSIRGSKRVMRASETDMASHMAPRWQTFAHNIIPSTNFIIMPIAVSVGYVLWEAWRLVPRQICSVTVESYPPFFHCGFCRFQENYVFGWNLMHEQELSSPKKKLLHNTNNISITPFLHILFDYLW